jgi:hypothetical protein
MTRCTSDISGDIKIGDSASLLAHATLHRSRTAALAPPAPLSPSAAAAAGTHVRRTPYAAMSESGDADRDRHLSSRDAHASVASSPPIDCPPLAPTLTASSSPPAADTSSLAPRPRPTSPTSSPSLPPPLQLSNFLTQTMSDLAVADAFFFTSTAIVSAAAAEVKAEDASRKLKAKRANQSKHPDALRARAQREKKQQSSNGSKATMSIHDQFNSH